MSSIDTFMPGSPAAVHGVADWCKTLKDDLEDAAQTCRVLVSDSHGVWTGMSGDAYRDFARDLADATEEVKKQAGLVEDKTRSYAQQLGWRQEDMADHRDEATKGGLQVSGTKIEAPPAATPPADLPAGSTQQEADEWDRQYAQYEVAKEKVDLYNRLLDKVRKTFDELDTWVTENLVDMEIKLGELLTVTTLVATAVDTGSSVGENAFATRANSLREAAHQAAVAAAAARSGNPAVRAGSKSPREQAVEKAKARGKGGQLLSAAEEVGKWGKRLARGSLVGAVALAAWDIAQGESPSKVAVETVMGVVGSAVAAGAIVLAGVSMPAWGTIAVTVGVGAAVALGAGLIWEHAVPQATREKIDEGIRDVWDGATGAVGDAWRSVFG